MECNRIMDIFAYYFSEYDMEGFTALGFDNRTQGMRAIASIYKKKTNYLKRLRDEYDVVTSSTRNGQRNREPRKRIVETAKYLSSFSFQDLTEIVKSFVENKNRNLTDDFTEKDNSTAQIFSEEELENLLNAKDPKATIKIKNKESKIRVYNTSIIKQLKRLYNGCCQLCGDKPIKDFDVDICEAHHIKYFSESQNNDSSNIIILCPNHHRLIHIMNPVFNAENGEFDYGNGKTEKIQLDYHLLK